MSTPDSEVERARARLLAWLHARGDTVDRVVETHVSVLAFVGGEVFKVKKPLAFGFADFRSLERRRRNAEDDVALNRRLAPDVYLGTCELAGADGAVADVAVRMLRLDEGRRLSTLVNDGDGADFVRTVAGRLDTLHRQSSGGLDAVPIERLWDDSIRECHTLPLLRRDDVEIVAKLARRYAAGRGPLFARRAAAGRIVDGHGDVLADDVYCTPTGPQIIDCLEFDPQLRIGDALLDAAFLAMDLGAIGRPDLAAVFLDEYRSVSGDSWPSSLAHYFVAYRALVRAKVAALRAEQGDAAAGALAHARLAQCRTELAQGRVRLVLIGGLPGSGKSVLGAGLARRRAVELLRTDVVRRERFGDPEGPHPVDSGRYDAAATQRVYEATLDRAVELLRVGVSVAIDASWAGAARRATARALAADAHADVVEIECVAPAALCRARLRSRLAEGGDASDATVEVHEAMRDRFAAWPEAARVENAGVLDDAVDRAVAAYDLTSPQRG